MEAFSNALGPEGIIIAQVGEADEIDDAPEPFDIFNSFLHLLHQVGFEHILDFEEAHGRFDGVWSFTLAMKDYDSRANWFMNEAELQLEIYSRLLRTKNGEDPLHFFDGASLMHYQFPSRVEEETWCREHPAECEGGHGFDPEHTNIPVSSFEVKPSGIAKGGRGVFAKEFIPKGSVLALDECVHGMVALGRTIDVLEESNKKFREEFFEVLFSAYFEGYGWSGNEYVSHALRLCPSSRCDA